MTARASRMAEQWGHQQTSQRETFFGYAELLQPESVTDLEDACDAALQD